VLEELGPKWQKDGFEEVLVLNLLSVCLSSVSVSAYQALNSLRSRSLGLSAARWAS
jgi:hypothetical protein